MQRYQAPRHYLHVSDAMATTYVAFDTRSGRLLSVHRGAIDIKNARESAQHYGKISEEHFAVIAVSSFTLPVTSPLPLIVMVAGFTLLNTRTGASFNEVQVSVKVEDAVFPSVSFTVSVMVAVPN